MANNSSFTTQNLSFGETAKGQFLVYQAEDGKLKLDVRFEDESVWLTQQLMADLFQTTKQNISLHIQNIYEEGELVPEATVKKYLTVRSEGNRQVKRLLDYYNLDMIISIGYRIKSHVATRFRIWATKNYMNEEELAALNNLVEQYLIFAQGQAMRRVPMHMSDWIKKLYSFMTLNDRDILMHAGKISHEMAKELAEGEYDKFHTNRLTESSKQISDFDKAVMQIESSKKKRGTTNEH